MKASQSPLFVKIAVPEAARRAVFEMILVLLTEEGTEPHGSVPSSFFLAVCQRGGKCRKSVCSAADGPAAEDCVAVIEYSGLPGGHRALRR